MGNESLQFTDEAVSKAKFEEEIEGFKLISDQWRKKGVFLVKAEFPVAEFIFATPKLKPASLVYAVRIDFTNYNAGPLSVKFIDPFTGDLVVRKNVPIQFTQAILTKGNPPFRQQDLLQGPDDEIPFFCMRGIREYHNHAFHTGDSWALYRGHGIGTLNYVLDQLYDHSIVQIVGHKVDLRPLISFQQQVTLQQTV